MWDNQKNKYLPSNRRFSAKSPWDTPYKHHGGNGSVSAPYWRHCPAPIVYEYNVTRTRAFFTSSATSRPATRKTRLASDPQRRTLRFLTLLFGRLDNDIIVLSDDDDDKNHIGTALAVEFVTVLQFDGMDSPSAFSAISIKKKKNFDKVRNDFGVTVISFRHPLRYWRQIRLRFVPRVLSTVEVANEPQIHAWASVQNIILRFTRLV